MRSATGILTLCLVLSVNLGTLLALPVQYQCNIIAMVERVEHEMQKLNKMLNLHHIHPDPNISHHLTIDTSITIQKQNKSTACALEYMWKGLKLIKDHQNKRIVDNDMQKGFHDVIERVHKHIPSCLNLARCEHPKKPTFPESDFKAKKWTRSFMEASLHFLKDLIIVLKKPHKKT